jgi:hypothetical protein
MKKIVGVLAAGIALGIATPALAQDSQSREPRDSRYQIGMMEGVLEKAVEHGAAALRERLQKVLPADMLLSQLVRVRGVRLNNYGVIFDIDVPSLQSAPLWSLQTLDQNNLGLESAISALRAHVDASGDTNLRQALERMELAVPMPAPTRVSSQEPAGSASAQSAAGSPLSTNDTQADGSKPIASLQDAIDAYHQEVQDALMDAMLDHSRGLAVGPVEWLTVVAGGADNQPLTGMNDDAPQFIISIKGSDLADFLANRISHDEARQRIQVKVF